MHPHHAETYIAHGLKSRSMADRFRVVVHVSAETLVGARHAGDRNPEPARVSAETPTRAGDGGHVSAETRVSRKEGGPRVSAETPDLFDRDFSYLDDGPHVSAETVRRIACDASALRVIDGPGGEPLDIGCKWRVIPPALRRALKMRG